MLEELQQHDQWICWTETDGRKLPIDPKTGKAASTTNPKTWASYDQAKLTAEKEDHIIGLGFVFSPEDPFFGIDLDKCIEDGEPNEMAQDVLDKMADTYGEYSPSGNGAHIIGKGNLPDWAHNKNDNLGIEIYQKKRFFTMTFDKMPGTPDDIYEAQEGLYLVCSSYLAKKSSKKREERRGTEHVPVLQEGERDEGLFDIARSLFHKGVNKWHAYSVIKEVARHCQPPFDEDTACQKVDSAWKTEDVHPGEVIKYMNERYAVVNAGGTVMIAAMPPEHGQALQFLNPHNLQTYMKNRVVRWENAEGKVRKSTWLEYWLEHPERNTYQDVVFRPRKAVEDSYLNLWRGYQVDPSDKGQQGCQGFLDHIWYNVARERQDWYDYILDWITSVVRWPDSGPQTALVLRGSQGAGKGIIGHYLGRIFGNHYITVSQPDHFVGRFNAHLADKCLVFADEAIWGGDKKAEGELKHMITDPMRTVEIKGKDAFQIENKVHMIIASNENWVVPVGQTDRRFAIFDMTSMDNRSDDALNRVWDELNTGGPEALLEYLLNERGTPQDIRMSNIPHTQAKEYQKAKALGPVERVWVDWITQGAQGTRKQWERILSRKSLYEDFKAEAIEQRFRKIPSLTEFVQESNELFGALLATHRTTNQKKLADQYGIDTTEWHDREFEAHKNPRYYWVLEPLEEFERAVGRMGLTVSRGGEHN